ncbi:hypothetical protein [Sulfobacillus harzensis]|uniref:hypothetical protein n=1 Tax=Sulfobacillus harzensis TaxID=2729629 RepID=UPI001A9AABC6|nr:hypothetical protein [Sulfobacillus harzensis]
MPRWKLLLSKWVASMILMVPRSGYLAVLTLLGIYTMVVNGTLSSTVQFHFLLNGLI